MNAVLKEKTSSPNPTCLSEYIEMALERYFADLDGQPGGNLYAMVMQQVEKPLLETVLHHTRGNQTKAAQYLGINRATLRKRLKAYNLI